MTGGGSATLIEVATFLPGRCLGAIENGEEILGDLDEDEKNSFSESS